MVTEVSRTAQELNTLINSTNQLVASVGLEQLLPVIVEIIDQAQNEGGNIFVKGCHGHKKFKAPNNNFN